MTRLHQPRLAPIFLQSLATAALACSPAASSSDGTKEPVNVDLTASALAIGSATAAPTETAAPTATAAVPAPADPAAYARLFAPVESLAKAFPPGVELQGFIDNMDKHSCTPSPCPPAWKSLVDTADDRNAVVKRGGKLELVRLQDFPTVIGKVDTPEKAALRVRLDDYIEPGSCSDLRRDKFECAGRSASTEVAVRRSEKGFEVITYGSRDVCGGSQFGRAVALGVVEIDEAGELDVINNAFTKSIDDKVRPMVECQYPTRGRMFEGFVDLPPETCELEYYVRAHRHEAAAIAAFERLARELEAHGAPAELVLAARASAADEARHAALFAVRARELASRLGVAVSLAEASHTHLSEIRSLGAILRENAEEGCANETYAALVATHQALTAPSASFRALMTEIAADEREHAALAHAIHAWGCAISSPEDASELEAHRVQAARSLRDAATRTDAGAQLGEPSPQIARIAFDLVDRALGALAA